jgi:hypothetical protein
MIMVEKVEVLQAAWERIQVRKKEVTHWADWWNDMANECINSPEGDVCYERYNEALDELGAIFDNERWLEDRLIELGAKGWVAT